MRDQVFGLILAGVLAGGLAGESLRVLHPPTPADGPRLTVEQGAPIRHPNDATSDARHVREPIVRIATDTIVNMVQSPVDSLIAVPVAYVHSSGYVQLLLLAFAAVAIAAGGCARELLRRPAGL